LQGNVPPAGLFLQKEAQKPLLLWFA